MARRIAMLLCGAGLFVLAACDLNVPSKDEVLDSKLFDRRVKESPRDASLRECRQEAEQFRVTCLHCHTQEGEAEIRAPQQLCLTDKGQRARVMRRSPTFGLQQQCSSCHHTRFTLNQRAEKLFGPAGSRYRELEKELNRPID